MTVGGARLDDPVIAELEEDVADRRTARGVVRAAWALIALQALVRGWVGLRGYLSADDFVFESRAASLPLWSHDYLLYAWNGHLMPGSWLMVRLATSLAPLQVWPVVVMDLLLQAATGLVLLALLRELFGTRRAILVPLALFLFSAVTLPGFTWWSPALNQLPAMLAMAATLLLHVRYLRSGRLLTGLGALLAFLAGLACFEKLLVFAPLVLLMTAAYFVPGSWPRRLLGAVTLHWRVWTAWAFALGAYVGYYETHVDSTVHQGTSPGPLVDVLATTTRVLQASVLGGPWHWDDLGTPTNTIPSFSGGLAGAGLVVALAVVVGGAAVHRQSARAWLLPGLYLLASVLLVAASRAQLGTVVAYSYRYWSEVVLLAAVALPLSLLPLTGDVARGEVTVLTPRSWVAPALRALHRREPDTRGWSLSAHSRTAVVRAVVVLLVLSSLVSTARYDAHWRANPARAYVATLRSELAAAPPGLVLADVIVPTSVEIRLFHPYNELSRFSAPLAPRQRFLATGSASTDLAVTDDEGHLRAVTLAGVGALPGPRSCGWLGTGSLGVAVPLESALYDYDWTIRIGYLASEDTTAVLSAGDQRVPVQLHRGLHAVWARVSGAVSSVALTGLADGTSVCTDDVRVGTPEPLPGPPVLS
ncbi:MAG: hypothetical protein ACXVFU_12725 [Nocardioidaceae bacterium]